MHVRNIAIAALTGAATAMPAPQSSTTIDAKPPKDQEFALGMTVLGDTFVSLNAVTNGTIGNLVLEAQRPSVYPGTPAYFNGSAADGTAALNFDLTDSEDQYNQGIFGARVRNVGDNYGISVPVDAIFGFQQFEWGVYNRTISHKLTAATQHFFACKGTVNGEENYYLAWGVFASDGSPPAGCEITTVTQVCNVEGGLKC